MKPKGKPTHAHIIHPPQGTARHHLLDFVSPALTVSFGDGLIPTETSVLVTGRPTQEQLAACPELRALIIPYAGVPAVTRDLLLAAFPDLPVYNLHHNAVAAAELAIALLLTAAKTLIPVDRAFRGGDWRSRYDGAPTTLLEGKRILILGLGAIGSRIATVCDALGMSVSAVRRNPDRSTPSKVHVHPMSDLHGLLSEADVLAVTLPLTPETEGLIGAKEIGLLPDSAIVVNIARGAIIDEKALFDALRDGRLAAAGLDVWYRYPTTDDERASLLPSEYPFHELVNVVMSPHRGGAFRLEELEARRMHDLAVTLNAIASGGPVPHRVDLEAGY